MAWSPMSDARGYLTEEEVHKMIDNEHDLRNKLLLRILYYCARRVSEVVRGANNRGIKVSDILWQQDKIVFSILKKRRKLRRAKPVDTKTLAMLKDYIISNGLGESDWVFDINRHRAFQIVRRAGKRVGILKVGEKTLHPHHLRHSFAVHWVKKHAGDTNALRYLQMILEHSDMGITGNYLQFAEDESIQAYKKFTK